MRKLFYGRRWGKCILTVAAAACICACIAFLITPASAASQVKIPDSKYSLATSAAAFNFSTQTFTRFSSSGNAVTLHYNNDRSDMLFCVQVKDWTQPATFSDCLDLYFENVGAVAGRQIDAKVHINRIFLSEGETSDPGFQYDWNKDGYVCVIDLRPTQFWVGSATQTANGGYNYHDGKQIDLTLTLTWHDTGAVVNIPLYQSISDIDGTIATPLISYYPESWRGISGYGDIIYTYESFSMDIDTDHCKISASPGQPTDGQDMYLKAGAFIPMTSGTARMEFTENYSTTHLAIYSPYRNLSAPTKSIVN